MAEPLNQKPLSPQPAPKAAPPVRTEEVVAREQKTREFVLIRNNSTRVHGIGTTASDAVKGVQVGTSFNLMPGVNKVDREAWETAKTHKMVAIHIEEGTFEEAGDKPLKMLELPAALNVVRNTLSVDLLKEFAKQDKREKVQSVIAAQLKLLQEPAKQDDAEK